MPHLLRSFVRYLILALAGMVQGLVIGRTALLLTAWDGDTILPWLLLVSVWLAAHALVAWCEGRGVLRGYWILLVGVVAVAGGCIPCDLSPSILPWLSAIPALVAAAAVPYLLARDRIRSSLPPSAPPLVSFVAAGWGLLIQVLLLQRLPPLWQDVATAMLLLVVCLSIVSRPSALVPSERTLRMPRLLVFLQSLVPSLWFAAWARLALQGSESAGGAWAAVLIAYGLAHACAAPRLALLQPLACLPILAIALVAQMWFHPINPTPWYPVAIAVVIIAFGCPIFLRPAYARLHAQPSGTCRNGLVSGQAIGFALGAVIFPLLWSQPWEIVAVVGLVAATTWSLSTNRLGAALAGPLILGAPVLAIISSLQDMAAGAQAIARDTRGDYRVERLVASDGSIVGRRLLIGDRVRGREVAGRPRGPRYQEMTGIALAMDQLRQRHGALVLVVVGSGECPLAAFSRPEDRLILCDPHERCARWAASSDSLFSWARAAGPSIEFSGALPASVDRIAGAHLVVIDADLLTSFPRSAWSLDTWQHLWPRLAGDGVLAIQIPSDPMLTGTLLAGAARLPARALVIDTVADPQDPLSGSRWILVCKDQELPAALRNYCSASTGPSGDPSWTHADAIGADFMRDRPVVFDRWLSYP